MKYDEIKAAWNAQAGKYNQWDELSEIEKIEWAVKYSVATVKRTHLTAQEDGWIQDGPLLYRLTDERRPRNRDEIRVTMANSSRTEEARTRRASEILYAIRTAEAGKVMK